MNELDLFSLLVSEVKNSTEKNAGVPSKVWRKTVMDSIRKSAEQLNLEEKARHLAWGASLGTLAAAMALQIIAIVSGFESRAHSADLLREINLQLFL